MQLNHNPDSQTVDRLHIINTKCGGVQTRPVVVQNALICHVARHSLTKHLRVIGKAGPHLRHTPGVAAQNRKVMWQLSRRLSGDSVTAGACACWSWATYKCTLLVCQVEEAVHALMVSTMLRRPPPCSCKALPQVVICWVITTSLLRYAHSVMYVLLKHNLAHLPCPNPRTRCYAHSQP